MGFLNKKGEIVDLTRLQKQGILKSCPEISSNNEIKYKGEFVDLSENTTQISTTNSTENSNETANSFASFFGSTEPQTEQLSNPLDTLNSTTPEPTSYFDATTSRPDPNSHDAKISNIHVKIENFEYKLDQLIERLSEVEKKLNE